MMKLPKTYIRIVQKVEESPRYEHGRKRVDFIDENETCVLVLGGNGTNSDDRANGYAKYVDELLRWRDAKEGVNIYSVVYCDDVSEEEYFVPALIQKQSREVLLEKYGRKEKYALSVKQKEFIRKAKELYGPHVLDSTNKEISDPEYIERLFEKTLLYRISENGERLSFEEACRRVRKLNVVTHCHGAYVFLKLEEMMQKKMKELGYSKKEAEVIQKQLLCVSYAPYAPLGVSKSTMISFGSVEDDMVWHQNAFHQDLKALNVFGTIKLSYFEKKQGEVFVVSHLKKEKKEGAEHNFPNYILPNVNLENDAKIMVRLSQNAIVNGVKGALEERPLDDVKTLVSSKDRKFEEKFDEAKKNGQDLYAQILKDVRISRFFGATR